MEFDKELLKRALDTYGADNQREMIGEECNELITEINRYRRGKFNLEKMIDEIADVFIVMQYAPLIFDPALIQERINFKQDRLRFKLDNRTPKSCDLDTHAKITVE